MVRPNTNAQGNSVKVLEGIADQGACCQACRGASGCNLWVYCPAPGGW